MLQHDPLGHVDPFIGTAVSDLPAPQGLAATWWGPKPRIGNTHPGATHPFGMVSACAYSGAYPTGYGRYDLSTEGQPELLHDRQLASGFTHFQQTGTGAIRKYYNYFRVSPMLQPLDDLGTLWDLSDEQASPGRYAARLGSGVHAELTVGPKSAVHRYTFPTHHTARVVIDASIGGLAIPFGHTVPLGAHLALLSPGVAQAEIVVEGVPLAVHVECDSPGWRDLLWYDRRLMPGGRRLDFDAIRPTTLRPFGLMWTGSVRAGQVVEVRMGFSLRGCDQARSNLSADLPTERSLPARCAATEQAWREHLGTVRVDAVDTAQRTVVDTALYHSMIKPCFAPEESPWGTEGAYAFDICTMWDIYRAQLPLLTTLFPQRATDLATTLLTISEQEGNLPIGYRMAKGADRFSRQGSALAHTFLADLCALRLPGIDWEWAMVHLEADLRRTYGEDYLAHHVAHPISHTLDLAHAYWCTASIARRIGDGPLAAQLEELSRHWRHAFDPATGLLVDSTYYEGGRWNYSFRLLPDMAARIGLAGGDEAFVGLLDTFFGYGAAPVTQPGVAPDLAELERGYALHRFQGLNNEPDYEAPWCYLYAGRPDRTAEVLHAVLTQRFVPGAGGLPGNDDSGGLSAWYVWAVLGLWPVAGQSQFLLHPPAVPASVLTLPGGELEITTSGFVPQEPGGPVSQIARVLVDDEELPGPWLPARDLHRARHLHVDLSPRPSGWGTDRRPPSPGSLR